MWAQPHLSDLVTNTHTQSWITVTDALPPPERLARNLLTVHRCNFSDKPFVRGTSFPPPILENDPIFQDHFSKLLGEKSIT